MASEPLKISDALRFGEDFELDLRSYELRRSGRPVKLERIPMDLLVLLVERRGQLVSRDEIIETVWGKDVFLDTDNSINAAIRKIRQVLKDDPEKPRYVQTLTGRGYRFIASVIEPSPPPVQTPIAEPPAAPERLLGRKISNYRVLELLGGGGMGVVYKAEDLKLGRRVAIKFLPAELASDPKAFERFEREARAASALDHRNICSIYQLGEYDGQPFIVMQLLEGETLREWIERNGGQKGPQAQLQMLDLAIQIVDGLDAAHQKGIIHRDIKPANIFITNRGEAKILDFGVAKLIAVPETDHEAVGPSRDGAQTSLNLTRTGASVGTPSYLSPEQIRGDLLDPRTDLFSLGLTLHEMITGRRAFAGNTVTVIRDAVLNAPAVPVRQLNSEISPRLEAIVAKVLEKDREKRYQSAQELSEDLKKLQRQIAGKSAAWRSPWAVGVAGVLAAVLIVGGLYYRSRVRPSPAEKDTVVLADFSNTTGDQSFDSSLKPSLSARLNQSSLLTVISDDRASWALQKMTRPPGTALVPEVAREVCLRENIRSYVVGSIAPIGNQYIVGLKAMVCRSGDILAQEQFTASSKENVLSALDDAAKRLGPELGEKLATMPKLDIPLEDVTTASLHALEAYSTGGRADREKGPAEALPYYQRAVELDPNFALAYSAVGNSYLNLGEATRAAEYLSKAFQLRERVSRRENLGITADYYTSVTGELEQAAQAYRNLIANYPRIWGPHIGLGNVYMNQGQYAKALEEFREAERMGNDNNYENIVNSALALQHFEESSKAVRDAQTRKLGGYVLHLQLYALAFLKSDPNGMSNQQQWFGTHPDVANDGLAIASDTEAYAGHAGKSRELTRQSVDLAVRSDSKEAGAIWYENAALREAAFGNLSDAKQLAAEGLQLSPESQGVQMEAALALAMIADAAQPASLMKRLEKRYPLDTQVHALWLSPIRAQLALDQKNPAAALAALPDIGPLEFGQISFLNNLSCLYPAYVKGNAYLAAGQGAAAAGEFQKIIDHSGMVWNCWTGALARLGLARANALQARTDRSQEASVSRAKALLAYKDFLDLWKDADPNLPIFKQAKAEYAKLQQAPSSR